MAAGVNLFLERDDVDVLGEFEGMPAESMEELVDDVRPPCSAGGCGIAVR